MGGTIIPGIAACGKRGGGGGRDWKEREKERSVMWSLGYICHHDSHITEMCSGIWRTKTTLSLSLRSRPQNQNISLQQCSTFFFVGCLNSFMQELTLLIVSSYTACWASKHERNAVMWDDRRDEIMLTLEVMKMEALRRSQGATFTFLHFYVWLMLSIYLHLPISYLPCLFLIFTQKPSHGGIFHITYWLPIDSSPSSIH